MLGGGYVGLEFAQPMRRFGARVTVLERGPRLAAREDPDVAEVLAQQFAEEGIEVVLNAETLEVSGRSGAQVRVHIRDEAGERTLEGSDLLVAAGRVPNTKDIGLDVAGVEIDERGYIKVNERLETTAPDVWGVGDCAGSPQFTHAGFDDFRIVRDNLAGGTRTTRDRLIPYCRRKFSMADASRNRMPSVAALPVATMIDIGVARPSAQGHAMINTDTALMSPYSHPCCPPNHPHAKNVATAIRTTATAK